MTGGTIGKPDDCMEQANCLQLSRIAEHRLDKYRRLDMRSEPDGHRAERLLSNAEDRLREALERYFKRGGSRHRVMAIIKSVLDIP